jgi:hypothetical protein
MKLKVGEDNEERRNEGKNVEEKVEGEDKIKARRER